MPTGDVSCMFGGGEGGGVRALAAVTFLCDTDVVGKFDIFIKQFWKFWKHLGKGCKITLNLP